jgi:beta-glucosidase
MTRTMRAAVSAIVLAIAVSGAVGESFPPNVDCASPPQSGYPFCDTTLTAEERAADLVARLSADELVAQTWSVAAEVSRLGMQPYNWR